VNTASLQQDKKILLAQCDLDRKRLSAAVMELEAKTGWAQLGATACMYAIPKLRLAMPVLSIILPYLLPGGRSSGASSASGVLGTLGKGIRTVIKVGQKAALLGKGVQIVSKRLRSS